SRVGAAVIADDNFLRCVGLTQNAFNGAGQSGGAVVRGNDDADWHPSWRPGLEVHVEFASGIPPRSAGPAPAQHAETKQDFRNGGSVDGEKRTPSSPSGSLARRSS